MAAIAERYIPRMAAAADGYGSPSTKAKTLAFLIHNLKIAFDANRTITEDRHFGSCHESLLEITTRLRRQPRLQQID